MKNKGMRLLAAVLLCGMLLLCPRVRADETADAAAPDPVFAGERSVVYAIDSGLLPNYLVGGKTALDGYLRVYQPRLAGRGLYCGGAADSDASVLFLLIHAGLPGQTGRALPARTGPAV